MKSSFSEEVQQRHDVMIINSEIVGHELVRNNYDLVTKHINSWVLFQLDKEVFNNTADCRKSILKITFK